MKEKVNSSNRYTVRTILDLKKLKENLIVDHPQLIYTSNLKDTSIILF